VKVAEQLTEIAALRADLRCVRKAFFRKQGRST
jgi:hypothetical protein